ncbi:MAG: hypothetical protein ABEK50_07305, partial [bacterium]
ADSYEMALQSVTLDEVWGLGSDFQNRAKDGKLGSFAELLHMDEQTLRNHFGATSRALKRIFNGSDPNPL